MNDFASFIYLHERNSPPSKKRDPNCDQRYPFINRETLRRLGAYDMKSLSSMLDGERESYYGDVIDMSYVPTAVTLNDEGFQFSSRPIGSVQGFRRSLRMLSEKLSLIKL